MNIISSDLIIQSLVIMSVGIMFFCCSCIFTRYAIQSPFNYAKLASFTLTGVILTFIAMIINRYYPLLFFTVIVPLLLCASMVHCLISAFDMYLQHTQNQTIFRFSKLLALSLNYSFFGGVIALLIYLNNAFINEFIGSLCNACIKIGVVMLLYLLCNIQACVGSCDTIVIKDENVTE